VEAALIPLLERIGPAALFVIAATLMIAQIVSNTRWIHDHRADHEQLGRYHEGHTALLSELQSSIRALEATCRERMRGLERMAWEDRKQ